MQKVITKQIDFNGKQLKLETGKLALQADAAVVATRSMRQSSAFEEPRGPRSN
jgi:polyribonucleotide nucleotidyltransferase